MGRWNLEPVVGLAPLNEENAARHLAEIAAAAAEENVPRVVGF